MSHVSSWLASDLTVLARWAPGEGNGTSWVVIGLVIAGWFIIRAGVRSAEKSRMKFAATDRKRCPHCRSAHPGFATYCRQCGARF